MYFLQRFVWWIVVISACTVVAVGLVALGNWVMNHVVTLWDKVVFLVAIMMLLPGVFAWLDAS